MASSVPVKCSCEEGYENKDGQCEVNYFDVVMSVNSQNRISLIFEEELKGDLKQSSLQIKIEGVQAFTFSVRKKDSTKYYLPLKFLENVDDGTSLNLTITENPLKSLNYKILKNYTFTDKLHGFLATSIALASVANATEAAAQIAVASSLGTAIVSNPTAAWTLINTIQIISYIPLNSNTMPDGLKAFITGLGGYTGIIPNPFIFIFDSGTSTSPYLEARNFGTNTSVFWINIGPAMTTFLLIVSMWPIFYLLSKFQLGKISLKIFKLLGNYRYNFFLRFWTQAYLDVGFAALIQLRSVIFI